METLKALVLTISMLNLVSKGFFFTILSYYRPLDIVQDSRIQAIRSSFHRQQQLPRGVLQNFAELTGKHLCRSLFFHNVAGLRTGALLKIRHSDTGVFLKNIFLRTPIQFVRFAVHNRKLRDVFYTACLLYGAMYIALYERGN